MRLREFVGAISFALLCASPASAQDPWKILISLSRDPIPIGSCVSVTVKAFDPVLKGTARTVGGHYVSNAGDFGMSIESPVKGQVIGKYESSSVWAACSCRGATVGSKATITATYPSPTLAANLRVPGVRAQGTAAFTIGPGSSNNYNPPGCMAKTVAATPPPSAAKPLPTGTPVSVPVQTPTTSAGISTMATPPTPPPGTSTIPATGTVSAPVPTGGTTSPVSGPVAAPPTSGPSQASPLSTPGPKNVRVLAGSPMVQNLAWDRPVGVASYEVFFKMSASVSDWTQMTNAALTKEAFADSAVRQPGVMYRVTAIYANGGQGSTDYTYTNPPPLQVPTRLTATELSKGKVRLAWPSMSGVKGYRILGSGRPADGTLVQPLWKYEGENEILDIPDLPVGDYAWQVTADYGGVYQTAGLPSASITLLSDRFRISILGFQVIQETSDDVLSRDGKNNEVYAVAVVCTGVRSRMITDQFGKEVLEAFPPDCATVRSAIHGDVNGFPGRVKAGSGSPTGGITSGDLIGSGPNGTTSGSTTTFPFLLWEGSLDPNVHGVWVGPSLWESGGKDYEVPMWAIAMKYSLGAADNWNPYGLPQSLLGGGFNASNPSGLPRCGTDGGNDRVIGLLARKGSDPPVGDCLWIGLSREKAEAVLRGPPQEPGKPAGVLTIDLIDAVSGHYLMYIKLERVAPIPEAVKLVK